MSMKFLISLLCICRVRGQNVVVGTEYGDVQGRIINVFNGRDNADVTSFHAIPFAQDTSGPNRFANPVPPDPWDDVFVADTLGDACAQSPGGLLFMTHPLWRRIGENCLHLDIYTPDVNGGPYPVMLWFYGGAFQGGANFQYPGHFLASRDVVVVSANYRLGKFGYAYTGNDACPGNAGLWDQKMALDFVVDNIRNFGGNPDLITIFGQSAGAASTAHLVVSPQTKDSFQQAIMESGTESSFWALNWPESGPEDYIRQVAEQLDCLGADDYQTIDCLRAESWETVHNTSFNCTPGHFCLGMVPVVDGEGGFLPEKPQELRKSGDIMTGPIISGITKDDGSFYTLSIIPESLFGGFNRTEFEFYLVERLLGIWEDVLDNKTREDGVRAVDYNYAPWPYIEDEYENREAFNKMITDAAYGGAWDVQIKDHQSRGPTFAYLFNYRGRNSTMIFPEWMGVPHMGELPYVWGYPLLLLNDDVRNDSLIYFDIIDWTDEDIAYTIFWQDLYANFAKFGNPTPTPVPAPVGGDVTWPRFTYDDMNVLYVHNTTVHVEKEWRQKDYAFWREYMAYVVGDAPVPVKAGVSSGTGMRSNQLTDVVNDYMEWIVESRLDGDETLYDK